MNQGTFATGNETTHNVESFTVLGRNLRELRRRRNLSQQAVADLVGLTRGCLSKYEVGHAVPALRTLATLAITYRISLAEILEGVEAGELL